MKKYVGSITDHPATLLAQHESRLLLLQKKAQLGEENGPSPLGQKLFERASKLLQNPETLDEAKMQFEYLITFYPSAPTAPIARKILGEINIDHLLDPRNPLQKKTLTVKSGDNLVSLAREHATSLDNFSALSGALSFNPSNIHPGDKLTYLPLDFKISINRAKKTLTLSQKGHFIKEYLLLAVRYQGKSSHSSIQSIRGWKDGRSFLPHSSQYPLSQKVIYLKEKHLSIRSLPPNSEEIGQGFFLASSDMEELPILLRVGIPIEIL